MSQAFPKTIVLDVGKSWTKAFSISNDKNKLVVEKKVSLPTTVGDLGFSVDRLIRDLKGTKQTPYVVTGALPEAESLAKNLDGVYVDAYNAEESFSKWLSKSDFKAPILLDTGEYSYAANLKISQIGAFLTAEVNETDIENYFGNKSLKPQSIPTTPVELEIEEAFYRVAFSQNRDFLNAHNVVNILVTGAFFSLAPKKSKLALILLDILSKGRVAQVKIDRYQFLHGYGALLKKHPEIADWETNFLQDLGAFISFGGKGRVMLDYGFSENQELEIVEDEIALVPAPSKQKVEITFMEKEKRRVSLHGGAFGILLDGRVKPLKLAFGRVESRESMKRWQNAIEKVEMIE